MADSGRIGHVAVAILGIVLVGWVDYATAEYISLAVFYLLIVAYTTWFLGPKAGTIIAVACAGVGFTGDYAFHVTYLPLSSLFWNTLIRLMIYLLSVGILARLKQSLERERHARSEIAMKNAVLEALNRKKDEYVAICSHDLRSPIVSVFAGIKVLLAQKKGALTGEQQDILRQSMETTQTLLRLIDNILDLERIEAGKEDLQLDRCDLNAIAKESVELHIELARSRDVEVRFVGVESVPQVRVDRLKILRVINNLISNAVKHSPIGSTVIVRVSDGDVTAVVSVTDKGPGLSSTDMQAVFDRFGPLSRRKKDRNEGTGLGLSIAQALVRMHGGSLEVESELGRGSTFRVLLPKDSRDVGSSLAEESGPDGAAYTTRKQALT